MRLSVLVLLIVAFVLAIPFMLWNPWDAELLHGPLLKLFIGGCVAAILGLLLWLYYSVARPIHALANGIDLLRAQDFSSRLAHVNAGEADLIIDTFNRMMDQLKTERLRLREQNHFFDLVVSVSPMGLIILTSTERISSANPSALNFLDCASLRDAVGRKFCELGSPLAKAIAKMPVNAVETLRMSDSMVYRCSRLSFMDNGFAHPFVLIERMTDEVVKAEKKAYEKVVRMIAHEVNNSIAGVNSTLDTASTILEESADSELLDVANVLRVCQERCVSMSRFITAFADVVKIPEANLVANDLNDRINASRGFLESYCTRHGVKLEFNLATCRLPVMIDEVLFEQALLNIVKNSIESTGNGGTVRIVTAGSPTTLTVEDNGPGISEEVSRKLFTPFYSSKPHGQGLGLIFISDVLTKHQCRFSLATSAFDGLTRFSIRFPGRIEPVK